MSTITIHLDHFQGHYFTGSAISGRVVCTFRKPKNIRGIKVTVKGQEYTGWTEWENFRDPHKRENRKKAVHYYGNNEFYKMQVSLAGTGEIGSGVYQYPFTFTLPKNLPGSYYGKYGWVKYHIKATVDRAYKFDFQDMRELVIISLIDFNDIREQLQLNPVSYSVDKMVCCWCCATGPILMSIHLEKEGFVSGETANIGVEVKNLSNRDISNVTVELGMKIESKTTTPRTKTKKEYQPLALSKDTGVGAHSERTYMFMLRLPSSIAVPNFQLCTLFTQWSKLKVIAELPTPHRNLTSSTRVVLGHIPIGQQVECHTSTYLPMQVGMHQDMNDPLYSEIAPYAISSGTLPSIHQSSSGFPPPSLEQDNSTIICEGSPQPGPSEPPYYNVAPYTQATPVAQPSSVFNPQKFEPPPTNADAGPDLSEQKKKPYESPPPSYHEAVYSTTDELT